MSKSSSDFVCQQCGATSPSFLGRCPNCQEWNTLVETPRSLGRTDSKSKRTQKTPSKPIRLSDVSTDATIRVPTYISELDRVLGGGIVPGMVILLSGEPGIGKSTLLLQLVENFDRHSGKRSWSQPRRARPESLKSKDLPAGEAGMLEPPSPDLIGASMTGIVLYVAGEESSGQIKIRANRLKIKAESLLILEDTDVDSVISQISLIFPNLPAGRQVSLIIVDSIQTLTTSDLAGSAGSVGQVRECASRLINESKRAGIPLIMVGHVTKEGTIAGPKVLEHAVDTVLSMEGERNEELRLIRAEKNRFGATDEVGIFNMTDSGLASVSDPNWINSSDLSNPGSCLTVTLEGTRPMVAEIQALVTSTPLPNPRRVASGVNYNRLQTIVAILQKRLNIPLYKEDIYVSVSGGLKIEEPAADLAIALAILSSYRGKALPTKSVAIGELDLLGNVRKVNSLDRRVKEARKLGFKNILTSENLQSVVSFRI